MSESPNKLTFFPVLRDFDRVKYAQSFDFDTMADNSESTRVSTSLTDLQSYKVGGIPLSEEPIKLSFVNASTLQTHPSEPSENRLFRNDLYEQRWTFGDSTVALQVYKDRDPSDRPVTGDVYLTVDQEGASLSQKLLQQSGTDNLRASTTRDSSIASKGKAYFKTNSELYSQGILHKSSMLTSSDLSTVKTANEQKTPSLPHICDYEVTIACTEPDRGAT